VFHIVIVPFVIFGAKMYATCKMNIFTDGACKRNGSQSAYGGIGVYFGNSDPHNVCEAVPPMSLGRPVTNQMTELLALLRALEQIIESNMSPVHIYSDSSYSVKSYNTWMHSWSQNGWVTASKTPVKNKDIMQELWNASCLIQEKGLSVDVLWCRGHQTADSVIAKGNGEADKLAVAAANVANV
jgi:ribonuclease HI